MHKEQLQAIHQLTGRQLEIAEAIKQVKPYTQEMSDLVEERTQVALELRRLMTPDDLVAGIKSLRSELWRLLDSKGVLPKHIKQWPEVMEADVLLEQYSKS